MAPNSMKLDALMVAEWRRELKERMLETTNTETVLETQFSSASI